METVRGFVEWVVEREVSEPELAEGWELVREGSAYFRHTTFDGPVGSIALREKDQVYLGKTLQNLLGPDVFRVVSHLPVDDEQVVMANTRNLQFPSFLDSTRTSASKVWDTARDGFRPHAAEGVISFPDSVILENPDDWSRLKSEVVVVVDDGLTGAQRKDLGNRPLGRCMSALHPTAVPTAIYLRHLQAPSSTSTSTGKTGSAACTVPRPPSLAGRGRWTSARSFATAARGRTTQPSAGRPPLTTRPPRSCGTRPPGPSAGRRWRSTPSCLALFSPPGPRTAPPSASAGPPKMPPGALAWSWRSLS